MSDIALAPGTLIDYRDGDGVTSGIVSGVERNRLLVITEKGKTEKITPARVAFVVSGPSGPSNRGPAPAREAAAERSGGHARRSAAAAAAIDVASLWEVLVDEGGLYRIEDLAALATGGGAGDDGASGGGVLRALVADRLHFQRKDDAWTPRTREAVAGIRQQRERERARAEARRRFVQRARESLSDAAEAGGSEPGRQPGPIEAHEGDILRSIESLAVRGPGAAESRGAASVVAEIGVPCLTPEEGAFRIGVALGVFHPAENLYLRRFGIRRGFPEEVERAARASASRLESVISGGAAPVLRDFREEEAFTVDDEETVELDDALHVRASADGTVTIGIHVADPSAFLEPGDVVDREAAERGTSHYLPDGRIPMIPAVISEEAASLVPGQDRPVLSFLVRFSASGERLSWEIAPALIRSRRRIDYGAANERLREPALDDPFAPLARIARALEEGRRENGAVRIAAPEVEAYPDANGVIRLRRVDPDRPARRLVAEMMVLAGRLAAEYCTTNSVPVLYRRQSPPERTVPALPEGSYDPVATRQARRAMRRSEISPVPGPHAGLGLDAYVQATSPLRRYTDLVAHRQIRAHLYGRRPPYDAAALQRIAASSEEIERAARTTEKGSDEYWLLRYLEERVGDTVEAVVLDRGVRRTDIELIETLVTTTIPPRPDHEPGRTLRLVIERVVPRAGSISLREVS